MLVILADLAFLTGAGALAALLYMNWRVGPSVRISVLENRNWKLWFERAETCQRARTSPDRWVTFALRSYIVARTSFVVLCIALVIALFVRNRA